MISTFNAWPTKHPKLSQTSGSHAGKPATKKSLKLNTPLLAVKRILTPPSANGELHFLSRTNNPPKKLIYWLNTPTNLWMISTFNAWPTKHPKLSKMP